MLLENIRGYSVNYSPNLLRLLGTKLAAEFITRQRPPEQKLFQAIILQALEDAIRQVVLKKILIGKKIVINGF